MSSDNEQEPRDPRVEIDRRRRMADEMQQQERVAHDTGTWRYAAHVSPTFISVGHPSEQRWRIEVHGQSREGRTRIESFDIATMRAYCALFTEVLRQFDAGEIREPWEQR